MYSFSWSNVWIAISLLYDEKAIICPSISLFFLSSLSLSLFFFRESSLWWCAVVRLCHAQGVTPRVSFSSSIMKLKQRVVVLCGVLLLLGLAKLFLLDGGEGSAASRRDLRAFRKMEASLALAKNARLTHTLQSPWEVAAQWVGPREVYPDETPELAAVFNALISARIQRADVGYKGTQLKALLVLDGGQKVVFKPKR